MIVCLAIFWLAGSPFFANRALTFLEGKFVSRPGTAYPQAEAIVVLSGGVARSLDDVTIALREYMGMVYYKLCGWI